MIFDMTLYIVLVEMLWNCIMNKSLPQLLINLIFSLPMKLTMRAFVVFTNGKNGTIGRQIPARFYQWVPIYGSK